MTLEIHPDATISTMADIEDSIRGSFIRIGSNTAIDSFVKIKPAGGIGDLTIGDNCQINSGCVIYTGNGIEIGDGVLIAANTTLAPTNHEYSSRDKPIFRQGHMKSKGGISIGCDVWIGANCVILDGAKIGRGTIIAAGSVVLGEIDEYSVYGGAPAKMIKQRP